MKRLASLAAALALTTLPLAAQDRDVLAEWALDPTQVFDGSEIDLEELRYVARPIIVFADSPLDPAFQDQMELLFRGMDELVERDVILITDTDPGTPSSVRTTLRPRGFMLTLIGKDGGVKFRKPLPWDIREITRNIDKFPVRQREIEARRGAES